MSAQSKKSPEPAQLEIIELTFGLFTFPTSIFATEAEARASWRRYRADLLDAAEPGERPRAYFLFELGVKAPARWFDQLSLLLDRQLICEEEAIQIDLRTGLLCATQTARFFESFEDVTTVASQGFSVGSLKYLRCEFRTAERWHEWRNRAELSAKYKRLAAIVDAVIEGREEL